MNSNKEKTIIIVVGPTAVGKTSFAIRLAKHFKTEIISADSRQCFKELNIGVAKPTFNELQSIPHYFINSHSITEEVNAGIFEKYAVQKADEIFTFKNIAVMVGGTGLYINAFCNGMDEIPKVSLEIRNQIISNYQLHGLSWLQNEIKIKDYEFWINSAQQNPQRLMRALEVFYATGRSINSFKNKSQINRPFKIIKLGLELPKDELRKNIDDRVDKMIEEGLVEEVKLLIPFQQLNALQTVGYRELFDFFENKNSLKAAIERIKISTRQYAKRQLTWFKKDTEIHWIHPNKTFDFNFDY